MNWLTKLWRRLFKREVKPVDPIPYLGSLAPIYKAVTLAEPLPPPGNLVSPIAARIAMENYAEEAMREMERTDRRAQLVAAGLLADAAEADRDQRLEERVSRVVCPCEICTDNRRRWS